MAYWIDDGFDTWPETIRVGKAAAGLYLCCGAWISRNISNGKLTDAVVPADIAAMYGTTEWVAKLVAAGFWEAEGAGYRDVYYFKMGNPPAEKVAARRAADAARKARWRERAHVSRRDTMRDSPVSPTVTPRVTPRSPALPPLKGEGQGAAPASQALAAPAPTPPDSPRFTDGSPVGEDPYDRARWEAEDRARADEHMRRDQEQRDTARRGAAAARALLATRNGVTVPTRPQPVHNPEDQ